MAAELHLAKDALALHLLLQHFESLVDIVITNENLHVAFLFAREVDRPSGRAARALAQGYPDMNRSACVRQPGYSLNSNPSAILPARLASVMVSKKASERSIGLVLPAR